jgi:hypothetical protein
MENLCNRFQDLSPDPMLIEQAVMSGTVHPDSQAGIQLEQLGL